MRAAIPLAGLLGFVAPSPGCRARSVGGDEAAPPVAEAPGEVDRRALADAIDPGVRPPLSKDVPRFLLDAIGLPSPMPQDPGELVALARQELEGWATLGATKDPRRLVGAVEGLARGVVLAERAVELGSRDTKTLSILERLYDALDAPLIANDRAFFPQMMRLFVQSSAAAGHIRDDAAVAAFSDLVFGTLERAGPAHRHAVAELVRSGDDPALVADALKRVAPKLRREDDDLGVRAMRASIALRGDAAEPAHWVALADVCYAALDVPCGDDAVRRAEAGAGTLDATKRSKLDDSLKSTRTRARDAATALSSKGARGLGGRLGQARALLDLGRHREAKAAYERLRADFPREAAPVAGLARHAIVSSFDLVGASRIIEAAGPVENADAEYYEIAIGCRATALVYDILPRVAAGKSFVEAYAELEPMLVELRDRILAYEKLGADKGVVLHFLFDVGMNEAVPLASGGGMAAATTLLRGMLPRAIAIADRVPKSVQADLVMIGSAQFADDPKAAFAVLERPLPEDPEHVAALRRAVARYELAVTWERADGLDALAKEVAALRAVAEGPAVQMLEGDVHALVARLGGDAGAWPRAEAAYRAALGDPSESKDVRGLNNLAVAVAEQGRKDEAMGLLARATAVGTEETTVAKVNLAALRVGPGDLSMLESLETEGDLVEGRLLAAAWRAQLVPPGQRAALAKALRDKVAEETKTQLRPRVLPGTTGIALRGSLSIGLGYSTAKGLEVDISTASQPWLAMRPDALPLDPRHLARAGSTGPKRSR